MVDLPSRDLFRTVSPLQLGYWVIPGSSILTSTNERKPLYRYRWSWTSVRVTGEIIIYTCTFQGFCMCTWFLQDLSVSGHCSPGATELNFPVSVHMRIRT